MDYVQTGYFERVAELLDGLELSGREEMLAELEFGLARARIRCREFREAAQLLARACAHEGSSRREDVAGDWLTIAKGLSKQAGPNACADAEAAMAQVVDLAPSRGLPARALYLQQQNRLADAI